MSSSEPLPSDDSSVSAQNPPSAQPPEAPPLVSATERSAIVHEDTSEWFCIPILNTQQRRTIVGSNDPVRYGTLHLAFGQIAQDNIEGSLAECGVYKGHLSRFIHEELPDRQLYLFDTFEGFDDRDNHSADDARFSRDDTRFRDTSEEGVRQLIGHSENIHFRKGYFPETASGLENEQFAFVMMDFDKYEPTIAGLNFFYPLLTPGGFLFVHDYCNPESNWACSRAFDEFLADKPEKIILIPDAWGTAFIRKI